MNAIGVELTATVRYSLIACTVHVLLSMNSPGVVAIPLVQPARKPIPAVHMLHHRDGIMENQNPESPCRILLRLARHNNSRETTSATKLDSVTSSLSSGQVLSKLWQPL